MNAIQHVTLRSYHLDGHVEPMVLSISIHIALKKSNLHYWIVQKICPNLLYAQCVSHGSVFLTPSLFVASNDPLLDQTCSQWRCYKVQSRNWFGCSFSRCTRTYEWSVFCLGLPLLIKWVPWTRIYAIEARLFFNSWLPTFIWFRCFWVLGGCGSWDPWSRFPAHKRQRTRSQLSIFFRYRRRRKSLEWWIQLWTEWLSYHLFPDICRTRPVEESSHTLKIGAVSTSSKLNMYPVETAHTSFNGFHKN